MELLLLTPGVGELNRLSVPEASKKCPILMSYPGPQLTFKALTTVPDGLYSLIVSPVELILKLV